MNEADHPSWNDRNNIPTLMADAQVPGVAGAGVQIGNFQLQTLLGRGGMGEVWKAWDQKADRPVVIKLVPPELQRADEEMARVRDTFRRVHALQHQHICPLYLLDEDLRLGWYLVMKYIDGQTLSSYRATYAARHGGFPVEQAVKVLRPVAEALDYSHRHKVIHRDIKPQNILVVGDADDVQVVDFGLAAEIRTSASRYTQVQMDTSGTRPYMAPEQWKGQFQDAATDQYALATVAYELLAGRLPFESDDFDILRACVLNDPPESIQGLADSVNRVLLIGLAKRRQERFASCPEFVQAIQETQPSQAVREPTPEQPVRKSMPEQPAPEAEKPHRVAAPKVGRAAVQAKPNPLEPQIQAATGPPTGITNSIGMKMVLIPEGSFLMGSSAIDHETPEHRVRITKPFYLGIYPVTQAEYQRVMGVNPSHFQRSNGLLGLFAKPAEPQRPVEQVSWVDAIEFCQRLSAQENTKYRLPTEAEWEYACRARSTGRWCFGDNEWEYAWGGSIRRWCFGETESLLGQYAWYATNSDSGTHPVGLKKPNAWGLYDMHGNVSEWCADWFDANYYKQFADEVAWDPTGPSGGSNRVFRGGSWGLVASLCRSACRGALAPGHRNINVGFRLARSVS
ncbi:MAG: SUMF1/EgtB/PvdO family nonheme iron enzyme [Pirellulaceae bacterium]|nr:SUMF1/EgtB/PvdO family nonheme iron enzyme [Pirellulaceae bacterium]